MVLFEMLLRKIFHFLQINLCSKSTKGKLYLYLLAVLKVNNYEVRNTTTNNKGDCFNEH